MHTIYAIHHPDADKLAAIIAEMRDLGAPTIEAVDCSDYLMAIEGSHRLAAAHALGIAPIVTIHEQDDEVDVHGYDWDASDYGDLLEDRQYTAGEIAGALYDHTSAVAYAFDEAHD